MPSVSPPFRPNGQLEQRVLAFLEKRPGSENIDKLTLTPIQRSSEKADFFLNNRTVVCEVKKLQSDTKAKIDRLLEPVLADKSAPIFYGEWPLEKILKHYPNGEQIRREVFDAVTSAVQTFVRKANRQIRTTKEVFALSQAGGVLVVVNDLVEVLSPEVLAYKIGELFRKRTPSGQFQFPEIEGVWVLSETHVVEVSLGRKAIPGIVMARQEGSVAAQLVDILPKEWAQAHGMPYLEMTPDLAGTVKFESATGAPEPQKKMSRQALWERQYRAQPYLRRHTEAELKRYFDLVLRGMTPGFLKGANSEDQATRNQLLERWTHLLLEINDRGIDMRLFSAEAQAMGTKIRESEIPRAGLAEIVSAGTKPATIEAGKYYTNTLGKNLRCLSVKGDAARLLVLDQLMGKTLEMVVGVKTPNWPHYWPLLDDALITALEKRFARFSALHPDVVSGE